MKTSVRYKDYTAVQKIGSTLIIIAGALSLAKILKILTANHFIKEDLPNYLFLVGGVLVLLPFITKGIKRNNTSNKISIFLFALSTSIGVMAQDYSKQIDAFKQSFQEKSVDPIQPYVGSELKFDPVPIANTPAILANIVSNLPKLNSLTILETMDAKAKVKYDFMGLGVSESFVYFDSEGRFKRIELIENLIKQEMEARQKMQTSVQQPTFDDMARKHLPAKVEFVAKDGLLISGNLYEIGLDKPVILLCHQAGLNRIEYMDIAPRLNELGYNCLAIDQRSGGDFAGKPNNTVQRAANKGMKPSMLDARQDITGAIDYLNKKYKTRVIVWGSSYSSSLAMLEGVSNKKVKAIIAFSPGDYFGKNAPSLSAVFQKIDKPFFVTSSKEEAKILKTLIGNNPLKKNQIQFVPKLEGFHGSRALWTGQKGAEEYWNAVVTFLKAIANS